jgi:hypothetical protein
MVMSQARASATAECLPDTTRGDELRDDLVLVLGQGLADAVELIGDLRQRGLYIFSSIVSPARFFSLERSSDSAVT